jgi:hypothetical protein
MKELTKLNKIDPASEGRARETVLTILRQEGEMKEFDLFSYSKGDLWFGSELPQTRGIAHGVVMHEIIDEMVTNGLVSRTYDAETGRHLYRAL